MWFVVFGGGLWFVVVVGCGSLFFGGGLWFVVVFGCGLLIFGRSLVVCAVGCLCLVDVGCGLCLSLLPFSAPVRPRLISYSVL